MTFKTSKGLSISAGLSRALSRMRSFADRNVMIGWVLSQCIKEHLMQRFPGSQHFSPRKVKYEFDKKSTERIEGEAVVEVPGAGRAYHDVDIFPVNARALTIPLSFAARRHKAGDFQGLFKMGNVLALRTSGSIQPMFALVQHVHQTQDPTIMPSDDKMAGKVTERWTKLAAEQLDKELAAL